ncbi:hypothetical protein [Streptomyces sp. NBC_00035]|uniref:hypothetical protein n=1 Tax=Streptomyces sp. NBC_00035 TaxID=2903614 RepID=UPI003245D10B
MSDDRYGPGRPGLCGHLTGPHAPGSRLYPCGWRCARHTPAAVAGLPEAPPGPGWPVNRQPPPDTDTEAAAPTGAEHDKDTTP